MTQLISLSRKERALPDGFPFDVPAIRSLKELESVSLVRDFLQAPGRFLQHIWTGPDGADMLTPTEP